MAKYRCFHPRKEVIHIPGLVWGMACLVLLTSAAAAAPVKPAAKPVSAPPEAGLPLHFEANRGQTSAQVRYLARGQGYGLFLTPGEAVLTLKKASAPGNGPGTATAIRMRWLGANPAPRITAQKPQPAKVNYLVGNDPRQWHRQIPIYAQVTYTSLYSGIDLVFYGNPGQLEYDFVLAPEADPEQIAMAFQGADKISIAPEGDLLLTTGDGELRLKKPALYQKIKGRKKTVSGAYVLNGDRIGFRVSGYDRHHPLIIDPVLVYSTYLGGSQTRSGCCSSNNGNGIAVDNAGQAYVVGSTNAADFPTANPFQPEFRADVNVFISAFTADGASLRYSTYLGGTLIDYGIAIDVDRQGQAYVTGRTSSGNFPILNAVQPTLNTDIYPYDAFVAKLSADGSALIYSTFLGGSDLDEGSAIAVDARGRAFLTGTTFSANFPIVNALQPLIGGSPDAFITGLSADGKSLLHSSYLGGEFKDAGQGIAVNQNGWLYVAGVTGSEDFPTLNPLQASLGGSEDAFVSVLDPANRTLRYSTYLGGSGVEAGLGIALDGQNQAFVTGFTGSADFPAVRAAQPFLRGGQDAFVAKLNRQGSALLYSTYLGGSANDSGMAIAVDRQGQPLVSGWTESADFPVRNPVKAHYSGQGDAFVARLRNNRSALGCSTYLGGGGSDAARSIAADRQGRAYVTGTTASSDFPTRNALQPNESGAYLDAFVAKLR